ncbi:putative repeat protein (TIGR03943 family) [Glaciihabitans tibetensis]|uniref:Putative repeat protein (TIGR03943 family) n=1 Tax=Glaciihabitans tibetensis TaxID=1266600 RepID=A0A2T0VIV1_9MICO|nr:TIGR03943 family protein [Glaciihabitans tibetensis]PRY70137.1 putative repeat protein (TIGR03943 family) [Glaciihabitans tibetensis]
MSRSSLWARVQQWRGVVLVVAAVVATIWLALNNQLILYIHPRYVVFTVVMAAVALVLVVASFLLRLGHNHDEPPTRAAARLSTIASLLAVAVAVAMIVVPPATLTSATVAQRDINSSGVGAEVQSVDAAADSSDAVFAAFTVLDWASLLRQTSDTSFYASKPVDVTGFITEDANDPDNVFYVSRFMITCCAVDAQPVGVPVYLPGWRDQFAVDDWVQVTGEFVPNASQSSTEQVALLPAAVTPVGEPSEPYLF